MKQTNTQAGLTVNALSKLTGKDRRTLDKIVVHLKPVGTKSGAPLYALAEVEAAIAAKPSKSLRDEKLMEEIRKLRIQNDQKEGRLIDEARESAWLMGLAKGITKILWQKLVNEAPSPEFRIHAKRAYNAVMPLVRDLVKDPEQRALLHAVNDSFTEAPPV